MGESYAVFEAVHGAPDIAGQGKANPTALMLSAVMLLIHLGEAEVAQELQTAVKAVYRDGKYLTGDVGDTASTQEFTDPLSERLSQTNQSPLSPRNTIRSTMRFE
jgi:isocitrate dehydrogenase (NAD+)